MPKLTAQAKEELKFFINGDGRLQYAWKCNHCANDCKQSYRVSQVICNDYVHRLKKPLKTPKKPLAAIKRKI